MNILETPRLILRLLEPGDLDSLFALYSDPEITQFIPDAPQTLAKTREELAWFLQGHPEHPELGLWATILKETNEFVGRCGLLPWKIDGRFEVEVAYAIAQNYRGQGFGTEAALAIMNYGFNTLGFTRLVCLIDGDNLASIRVAEKMGMCFENEGQDQLGSFLLYAVHQAPT